MPRVTLRSGHINARNTPSILVIAVRDRICCGGGHLQRTLLMVRQHRTFNLGKLLAPLPRRERSQLAHDALVGSDKVFYFHG